MSALLQNHRVISSAPQQLVAFQMADPGNNDGPAPACKGFGNSTGDYGLRIASIFVILVGSLLGVFLPMALARTAPHWRLSKLAFFICRYFGSGVILSTAFMHLLSPAVEALDDECLENYMPEFDWAHAICLITIMVMFYLELLGSRFSFGEPGHGPGDDQGRLQTGSDGGEEQEPLLSLPLPLSAGHPGPEQPHDADNCARDVEAGRSSSGGNRDNGGSSLASGSPGSSTTAASESHDDAYGDPRADDDNINHNPSRMTDLTDLGASTTHRTHSSSDFLVKPEHIRYSPAGSPRMVGAVSPDEADNSGRPRTPSEGSSYSSQIVSLLVLEFGVVFHSLFIGLSLAGSDNIRLLLVVLTFHQFFEGLGLGTRLAVAQWPSHWRWQAWTGVGMAVGYGVTTPLGVVIGLVVNAGLASRPALGQLVNGVFDAMSAGILVYTAMVELLAHDFMFSEDMQKASFQKQQFAFACVALGVAAMTLLAKWA